MKKLLLTLFMAAMLVTAAAALESRYFLQDYGIMMEVPSDWYALTTDESGRPENPNETEAAHLKMMDEDGTAFYCQALFGQIWVFFSDDSVEGKRSTLSTYWDDLQKTDEEHTNYKMQRINGLDYMSYDTYDGDYEDISYVMEYRGRIVCITFASDEGITPMFRDEALSVMSAVRSLGENYDAAQNICDEEEIFFDEEYRVGLRYPAGWRAMQDDNRWLCSFRGAKGSVVLERILPLEPYVGYAGDVPKVTEALKQCGITRTSDFEHEMVNNIGFVCFDATRKLDGNEEQTRVYLFYHDEKIFGLSYLGAMNGSGYLDFISMRNSISLYSAPIRRILIPIPSHVRVEPEEKSSELPEGMTLDDWEAKQTFWDKFGVFMIFSFFTVILPCGIQRICSSTEKPFWKGCVTALCYSIMQIGFSIAMIVDSSDRVFGAAGAWAVAVLIGGGLLAIPAKKYRKTCEGMERDLIYGAPLRVRMRYGKREWKDQDFYNNSDH